MHITTLGKWDDVKPIGYIKLNENIIKSKHMIYTIVYFSWYFCILFFSFKSRLHKSHYRYTLCYDFTYGNTRHIY